MTLGRDTRARRARECLWPGLSPELEVTGLEYDSRKVAARISCSSLFREPRADGRQFAQDAVERGAMAVVSELPAPEGFPGLWIEVRARPPGSGAGGAQFLRRPDERIALTGITGTNGKTTTTFLIDSILRAAGKTTALIGTIEYHLAGRMLPAVNTTPESLDLYRLLQRTGTGRRYARDDGSFVARAGAGARLRPDFHTAVFTNLTRDHLDFHGTMEDYFAAKQLLFAPAGAPPPRWAMLNRDDESARRGAGSRQAKSCGTVSEAEADLTRAPTSADGFRRLAFRGAVSGKKRALESPLMGKINVYNILAACGAGLSYGLAPEDDRGRHRRLPRRCRGASSAVDEGQPFLVVVDYAHTDDALRNTIAVARGLDPNASSRYSDAAATATAPSAR